MGVWTETHGFGEHYTTIDGVRETLTDAAGRFVLERVLGLFNVENVTVYKNGYVAWNNRYQHEDAAPHQKSTVPAEIFLAPFPPWGDYWKHLHFVEGATSWLPDGAPRMRAAIDQARSRDRRQAARGGFWMWSGEFEEGTPLPHCVGSPPGVVLESLNSQAMQSQLTAPDPLTRRNVADAFRAFGNKDTLEAIRPLLQNPAPYVRQTAVRALGKLKDRRAVELVLDKLNDPDRYVQAAAATATRELPDCRALKLLQSLIDATPSRPTRLRAHFAEAYEHVQKVMRRGVPCRAPIDPAALAQLKATNRCPSCDLRGAALRGAVLQGANLTSVDFRAADLREADLRNANLDNADLTAADLRNADLRGAHTPITLAWVDFRGADLRRTSYSIADLRGVNLLGANATGTSFRPEYLMGAIWLDGRICDSCSRDRCQ